MSQVKVQWVADYELQDKKEDADEPHGGQCAVPVISLASLTDLVEGLREIVHLASFTNQGIPEIAQRLLTQLEAHR